MTLALDTQLDLLATKASPLKHPIPTSILTKGADWLTSYYRTVTFTAGHERRDVVGHLMFCRLLPTIGHERRDIGGHGAVRVKRRQNPNGASDTAAWLQGWGAGHRGGVHGRTG
jgi:hypothetical protein